MPARSASQTLRILPARLRPYICPSCQHARASWLVAPLARPLLRGPSALLWSTSRHATTITPVSTVNVKADLPAHVEGTYKALQALQSDAHGYVHPVLLERAIHELGRADGRIFTYVAIISENRRDLASLLTTLLTDPLEQQPLWEIEVADYVSKRRLCQIRYYKNYQRRKGELFDTLYVPSSFLKNNRLCLWVGTPQKRDGFREGHDFLLPYFVHEGGFASRRKVRKTLVFSENIETISDSDQNMQRLYRNGLLAHLHLVSGAENANANPGPPHVIKLNLQKASEAVNEMRCRGDADQYLRTWNESNANSVLKWLQSHSFREGQILSTALCEYIAYTIKSAIFKFSREKEEAEKDAKNNLPSQKSATQPPDSTDLWTVIQKWSENAHTELKEELEAARHGRVWASLIWWKLPLRSDEVNMYLTELLERHWLVNTEKELIWICGRLEQAKTAPLSYSDSGSPLFASWKEFPSASGSALKDKTLISTKLPDLSEVRRTLATTTIPPLAAQAQSLIVHAGSKTFFTGALAMLVYVSPPLTSFSTLSEAGAIAALGLAFSSYSLQKKWGAAKSTWLEIVRERGRQNLNDIEKWLGDIVKSPSANQRTDPPMSHMPSNEVLRRQEMAWKALIRAQREFGILRRANEQAFIDNQRGKNLKGTNDPVASDAAAAVVTTPKSDQQMDGSEPTVSYYHI